jgi:hypothetical protein
MKTPLSGGSETSEGAHQIQRTSERRSPEHAHSLALAGTVVDSLQFNIIQVLELLFPDSTFATPRAKRGYSGAQIEDLTSIAEECPSEFGNAVFMARAMLSSLDTIPFVYAHECETLQLPPSERRAEPEETSVIKDKKISVYPNPTSGLLNIEMNLHEGDDAIFEFYSLTGTQVLSARLNSGGTEIDMSECLPGIYFYRISINTALHFFGKQVIVR